MIEITRFKSEIRLNGHAGYAERGNDIVCAAVSALVQTLIYSLEEMAIDKIEIATENNQIRSIKYRDLSTTAMLLVNSFFIGVNLIAENYPENLKVVEDHFK